MDVMSMAVADLIGRPYSGEARTFDEKSREVDCYQLVREGLKRLRGVELPLTPEAALAWEPEDVDVREVRLGDAAPGDVVEMHMVDATGTRIVHVGLVVDGGGSGTGGGVGGGAACLRVLHARKKHRSCLTSVATIVDSVRRVVRYEKK
jgi:cell wall-associated NlpC family hydrolase